MYVPLWLYFLNWWIFILLRTYCHNENVLINIDNFFLVVIIHCSSVPLHSCTYSVAVPVLLTAAPRWHRSEPNLLQVINWLWRSSSDKHQITWAITSRLILDRTDPECKGVTLCEMTHLCAYPSEVVVRLICMTIWNSVSLQQYLKAVLLWWQQNM